MKKESYPKYPTVKATKDNKFVLEVSYEVKNILIPKGYKSNGANIPRIFWSLIPPNKPKFQPAIMIHDYLCDKEKYDLADNLFEEVLFEIEISWRTKKMVKFVRIYHKIKYGV
jgi:hypothetical protein